MCVNSMYFTYTLPFCTFAGSDILMLLARCINQGVLQSDYVVFEFIEDACNTLLVKGFGGHRWSSKVKRLVACMCCARSGRMALEIARGQVRSLLVILILIVWIGKLLCNCEYCFQSMLLWFQFLSMDLCLLCLGVHGHIYALLHYY